MKASTILAWLALGLALASGSPLVAGSADFPENPDPAELRKGVRRVSKRLAKARVKKPLYSKDQFEKLKSDAKQKIQSFVVKNFLKLDSVDQAEGMQADFLKDVLQGIEQNQGDLEKLVQAYEKGDGKTATELTGKLVGKSLAYGSSAFLKGGDVSTELLLSGGLLESKDKRVRFLASNLTEIVGKADSIGNISKAIGLWQEGKDVEAGKILALEIPGVKTVVDGVQKTAKKYRELYDTFVSKPNVKAAFEAWRAENPNDRGDVRMFFQQHDANGVLDQFARDRGWKPGERDAKMGELFQQWDEQDKEATRLEKAISEKALEEIETFGIPIVFDGLGKKESSLWAKAFGSEHDAKVDRAISNYLEVRAELTERLARRLGLEGKPNLVASTVGFGGMMKAYFNLQQAGQHLRPSELADFRERFQRATRELEDKVRKDNNLPPPDLPPVQVALSLPEGVEIEAGATFRVAFEVGGGEPPFSVSYALTGDKKARPVGRFEERSGAFPALADVPAGSKRLKVFARDRWGNVGSVIEYLPVKPGFEILVADPGPLEAGKKGTLQVKVRNGEPEVRVMVKGPEVGLDLDRAVSGESASFSFPVHVSEGQYPVTVMARDGRGRKARARVTLSVGAPLDLKLQAPSVAAVGAPLEVRVRAAGAEDGAHARLTMSQGWLLYQGTAKVQGGEAVFRFPTPKGRGDVSLEAKVSTSDGRAGLVRGSLELKEGLQLKVVVPGRVKAGSRVWAKVHWAGTQGGGTVEVAAPGRPMKTLAKTQETPGWDNASLTFDAPDEGGRLVVRARLIDPAGSREAQALVMVEAPARAAEPEPPPPPPTRPATRPSAPPPEAPSCEGEQQRRGVYVGSPPRHMSMAQWHAAEEAALQACLAEEGEKNDGTLRDALEADLPCELLEFLPLDCSRSPWACGCQ